MISNANVTQLNDLIMFVKIIIFKSKLVLPTVLDVFEFLLTFSTNSSKSMKNPYI